MMQAAGGGTDATVLTAHSDVTVAAVNDAPTLSATGPNPTYTAGSAEVGLYIGAAVSTVESSQNILQLVFTVSGLADGANEKIRIDGTEIALTNGTSGTTTGGNSIGYAVSVSSATATVTLSKTATAANWQTYINGMKYKNSLAVPTFVDRTVTLTSVKDDGGTAGGGEDSTSLSIASAVNVTYFNNEPILTTTPVITGYTENAVPASLFASTSITQGTDDPADQRIRKISLSADDLTDGDAEKLVVNGTAVPLTTHSETVTGGYIVNVVLSTSNAAITISRTGDISMTAAAIIIDNLAYLNSSDNPATNTRYITITSLQDDGGTAGGGDDTVSCTNQSDIHVSAVNDAPVLVIPANKTFTDSSSHTIPIQLTDPDISGGTATVTVAANKSGKLHVDAATPGLTIAGNDSDSLSLSGTLTVLNTALTGLTYKPAVTTSIVETLTVTADDGGNTGSGGNMTANGNIVITTNINTTPTKTVSKIVVTPPGKLNYKLGDSLDMTGMVVTAYFTDGSTRDVTLYSSVSGLDSSTVGSKTIQVFYGTVSATFTVYVRDLVLKEIQTVSPAKTVYSIGEAFDPAGMTVTALYEDGTSEDVTSQATLSGFDSTSAGLKTITVSYEGMTDTFYVEIKSASLSRIEITPPAKLTYQLGEAFDDNGMKVTAIYSDGSSEDVTEAASLSGFDSSTAGVKTITVGYSGKTASFTVTVEGIKELSSIIISHLPNKISYKIGESFQDDGLSITAIYSDNSRTDVTELASLSGFDSTSAGTRTVTAAYQGKTTSFEIYILNKAADFKSVTVEKLPDKLQYYVGDKFTAAGMQVNAVYLIDGTEEKVDVTDLVSISGFSSEKAGKKTIKVKYMGKSDTFKVEVLKLEIDELTLNTESLALTTGDTFNLTVTAFFADGTSKDVTSECKYKLSKKKILTIDSTGNITALKKGKVKVTVTYGGSKKSFYVNVTE